MKSDNQGNTDQTQPSTQAASVERQGTGFFSVLKSVLAAGFGVQSADNRKRDFTHGRASHFIVGGLIGTVVFILAIVVVVKMLLSSTGV